MIRTMGYERDEYENLDEYEEDVEEQEEEEGSEDGYEETHQPSQEELDYLELRQRLKETIRKQMKKELGTANAGSRNNTNGFCKDNYGSFFGPSQPVIAQRVIQESKSLLENPNLLARISKSNHTNKASVSASIGSKRQVNHQPKVSNGLKRKVEMLKNTRDYSFLLSDDAEAPVSTKCPPNKITAPKSETLPSQPLPRSKQMVDKKGRDAFIGCEEKKQVLASRLSRPNVGLDKMAPASKLATESRTQIGNNSESGPGRPLGPKNRVPSKSPVVATGKQISPPVAKNHIGGVNKSTHSTLQSTVRKPTSSQLQSSVHKPTPPQLQSSLSKKSPVQRKGYQGTPVQRKGYQETPVQRKGYQETPVQIKGYQETPVQRKGYQELTKPKAMHRQALSSSRDQVKQQPLKTSARDTLANERMKGKPRSRLYDEDSDNDDKAINMIRQMFRYNPNKYKDADDDSDMEANFDDIMREEMHSAKIARKEDEEELRLLEEEERRKRMRMAKKRKLSQQ